MKFLLPLLICFVALLGVSVSEPAVAQSYILFTGEGSFYDVAAEESDSRQFDGNALGGTLTWGKRYEGYFIRDYAIEGFYSNMGEVEGTFDNILPLDLGQWQGRALTKVQTLGLAGKFHRYFGPDLRAFLKMGVIYWDFEEVTLTETATGLYSAIPPVGKVENDGLGSIVGFGFEYDMGAGRFITLDASIHGVEGNEDNPDEVLELRTIGLGFGVHF